MLLTTAVTVGQSRIAFSDSLRITYTSGDESYSTKEMLFQIKDGKVVGQIVSPDTNKLLSSSTILNDHCIGILNSFINLAKTYQTDCYEEFTSSNIQRYDIIIDKDKLKIWRFCDWKIFTYSNLQSEIFGDYFKKLDKKKKEFNLQYSSQLIGNWRESEKLEKLTFDSKWSLYKLIATSKTDDYFAILKNQKAILYRSGKKTYLEYRFDMFGDEVYLVLFGDRKKKNKNRVAMGHRFLILEINENLIKMERG